MIRYRQDCYISSRHGFGIRALGQEPFGLLPLVYHFHIPLRNQFVKASALLLTGLAVAELELKLPAIGRDATHVPRAQNVVHAQTTRR